jgi:rod shape-determining protein MreC
VATGGRTRSTRGLVIMLVTVSLVVITIDYREGQNGPLSKLSDGLHSVVIPMQEGVSKVFHPVSAFFSALVHLPSNKSKLDAQERQIQVLQGDRTKLQHALDELRRVQAALDISKTYDFTTTGADVVGNGFSQFDWTIEIDKGSHDGIKQDMPVISSQGLVGRVVSVTPFGSQVLLITDFNSEVAARLEESQETGLLSGEGRGDLVMSSIAQATDVSMHEPVVTSGYSGGLFPAGLPIGTVASITTDAATGDKDVTVTPDVDFSKLDVVLVITEFNGG